MEFRLVYQGQLETKEKDRVAQKHAIRGALHPQLKDLWDREPLLSSQGMLLGDPAVSDVSLRQRVGSFEFVPLVSRKIGLFAELGITILRPDAPGKIIFQGGDIDNQLKVLFDALRMPTGTPELPPSAVPAQAQQPYFFCLLEDDALIRDVRVTADRLLAPTNPDQVVVLVHARLKASQKMWANLGIA